MLKIYLTNLQFRLLLVTFRILLLTNVFVTTVASDSHDLNHLGITQNPALHCVMYDECAVSDVDPNKKLNCVYNGPPKELPADGMSNLNSVCPELVQKYGNETCCSVAQVQTLKDNLDLPQSIIGRCPSCFYNFRQIFCELTCGQTQSQFLNVTKTKNDNGTLSVAELVAYVENVYVEQTYDSCRSVVMGLTNGPAMDLLCGPWGSFHCTAHRWFDYMGTTANGYSPFNITYNYTYNNYTGAFAPSKSFKCSESINNVTSPCGCVDCEASCPAPQPFPPLVPPTWKLFNQDGTYVLVGILCVFGNVLIAFLVLISSDKVSIADDANISEEIRNQPEITDANRLLPGEVVAMYPMAPISLFKRAQQSIKKLFGVIGKGSAQRPFLTLLVLIIPFGLSTSLLKPSFKDSMITDPVELWANPHSRTRIEKNFFDKNFAPFYRTEQIIISSKNPSFNRTNSDGEIQTFGPVFDKHFLRMMHQLQIEIEGLNNGSLTNICLKPLETNCTAFSLMEYWQNSLENLDYTQEKDDYLDHFLFCALNPTSLKDSTHLQLPCLGSFGGPVDKNLVVGGFPDKKEGSYMLANSTILTFVVKNHVDDSDNEEAKIWESAFISYMKNWSNLHEEKFNLTIAFNSERSIQDELSRESNMEIQTILISYIIMFMYIAFSLGFGSVIRQLMGRCTWRRLYWWKQLNRRAPSTSSIEESILSSEEATPQNNFKWLHRLVLSLVGVLLVLISVTASIGLFSYAGVNPTMIVMEVVPFLVLAVGVDNIFIIVQTYDRTLSYSDLPVPDRIGYLMSDIGPSLLVSVISESVCFLIGGLVAKMPAVETFAYYSAVALIIDFLLHVTVFIAVFGLCETWQIQTTNVEQDEIITNDSQLPSTSSSPTRTPVSPLASSNKKLSNQQDSSCVTKFFSNCYAPFILSSKWIRMVILMVFYSWLCISLALVHKVDVGLDQKLSMSSDSYVLKYFESLESYLEVGPPVYFVVASNASSPSLSSVEIQNKIAASGSSASLVSQIFSASKISNSTFIAKPASSWLDDYIDWASNDNCCKIDNNGRFCPNTNDSCNSCSINIVDQKMDPDDFRKYISFFVQDIPSIDCPKAGHAAYETAVSLGTVENKTEVVASYFMTYHTVLKTSHDFVGALKQAQYLSDNITRTLNNEYLVFPYSVFYVFYEQYLDTWHQVILNLGLSLSGICFVIFVSTFSMKETMLVFVTIVCIIIDLIGMMYVCGISLNALSLVNLVMAVGISVEFCVHLVCAFAHTDGLSNIERVSNILGGVGSSVFSGITLTKIFGISVLFFAKTKIFEVFYFRMYFLIVLIGAAHGLCFLPVLMSFVGGGKKDAPRIRQTQ